MAKTRTPQGNEDVDFFRCKRCGFPCKLTRDKLAPGLGIRYTPLTGVVSQDYYPDDPVVYYGCPQCGKGEYNRKW